MLKWRPRETSTVFSGYRANRSCWFKTMNVTEQSVMLSCCVSRKILSARRKLHTALTVGVSPATNSRLTVKKEGSCRFSFSALRASFRKASFPITSPFGDRPLSTFRRADRISPDEKLHSMTLSRSLFWINKNDLRDKSSQHYGQIWLLRALCCSCDTDVYIPFQRRQEEEVWVNFSVYTNLINRQQNAFFYW